MRTALSTIQQTLTAEAASVLTNSIADASRRHHGQTTPLHVAATLLAAPSGLLRQACARSHPNSSHPLQCRALELCFSVALDRLPSTSSGGGGGGAPPQSPPLSNALVAALKRAQAHQRRGCPETQQQPLLAVKVELEQLVLSILDDPSVSRVMREASFSSTAVKSTIEQSLSSSSSTTSTTTTQSPVLPNLTSSRNLYLNPRLQQQKGVAFGGDSQKREDEVRKVVEIMLRSKKRNPILVGDSDPGAVLKEVVRKIESGDAPAPLCAAQVVSLEAEFASVSDKSQIPARIQELGSSIDARIGDRGVVLNLGDLKWLVEAPGTAGALSASGPIQPHSPVVSESGRAAVGEMGRLLKRFNGEGNSSRGSLWLVGTATCATYLRCQVYHPAMENDWDLQAVPIAARAPLGNMFSRLGGNGILSSSVETLAPMKGFAAMGTAAIPLRRPPLLESTVTSTTSTRAAAMCQLCTGSYERELAKISAEEAEKSSSKPHWLQLGTLGNGTVASDQLQAKEQEMKKSSEELQKKWREACSCLHPGFHSPAISMPSAMLTAPKLALGNKGGVTSLQMNATWEKPSPNSSLERPKTPPGSPVKTDLVLGHTNSGESPPEKPQNDDYLGCAQDKLSDQQKAKVAGISDIESFERLFKGLSEKVSWQPDAASSIAAVVMQCKSGNGKTRTVGSKCGSWLLFVGADKVGKRKMATALSELVCGSSPVVVKFSGDSGEANMGFWGKTSLDRVVEAVRRNPFSLVVLEDIDRADALVRGKIKRAMERGRLPDSHGREVSLGSVIFILTASWLPEELNRSHESLIQSEEKILDSANSSWQLELSAGERPVKHRADWLSDDDRPMTKARKDSAGSLGLSLDLNLAVGVEDESGEGSRNSSDLTVEHEHEKGQLTIKCLMSSPVGELLELVDDAIVFRPVDFRPLRKEVVECISSKSEAIMGIGRSVRVDDDALDRIIGAVWLTGVEFEEWAAKVLVPSIKQLKGNLNSQAVLRLSLSRNGEPQKRGSGTDGRGLPTTVTIIVDRL
ncbi:protein SMAX1-like [Typha latifolia]|uniref:protein SMAX1-like n=1 Tax=Typha latifolia TaxID=4733 RepID=UPI003C2AAE61